MKRKLTITGIITTLFLILSSVFFKVGMVSAKDTSDEKLLSLYDKYDYILHLDDGFMITDVGRSFLWGVISLLSMFNNFIEGAVYKILNLNDFYSSPAVSKVMDVAKPLVFGLFVIAIFVLGFQFMMNKIEKREEVLLNILMAVTIIVIIPVLMTQMHKVLGFGVGYMQQTQPTLAGTVVQSNVADLKYYMDKGFVSDESKGNKYHGNSGTPPLPQSKFEASVGTTDFSNGNKLDKYKPNIAIRETINIEEDEGWFPWTTEKWVKELKENNETAYDFMLHKRLPTGVSDGYGIVELQKNKIPGTQIGQEAYYRWHVNWGTIIFTLIVTSFALVVTIIKIGRVIFDLAFHQVFGMFVAVTDLTGGQRTKKVLAEIANSFGVLFIMVFILQLFILYSNWVNSLKADIGFIPVLLLLVAGAWAVIDAPDIVQRMMGIDAGLRSGYGALVGAYAGVGVASKLGKGAKNIAGGAVKKGAGAVSFGAGALKGVADGQSKTSNPSIPNKVDGFSRVGNTQGVNATDGNDNGFMPSEGIPNESNQYDVQNTSEQDEKQLSNMNANSQTEGGSIPEQGNRLEGEQRNNSVIPNTPSERTVKDSAVSGLNTNIPSKGNNRDHSLTGAIDQKSNENKSIPSQEKTNIRSGQADRSISKAIPSMHSARANRGNQDSLTVGQKSIPTSNNRDALSGVNNIGQTISSQAQQSIGSRSVIGTSGYTQSSSGIYIPDSLGSGGKQTTNPTPQSESSLTGGSPNVHSPIVAGSASEINRSQTPANTPNMSGGAGWVSGSPSVARFRDEVQRAGN